MKPVGLKGHLTLNQNVAQEHCLESTRPLLQKSEAWLLATAFGQVEEAPDNPMGLLGEHLQGGAQLLIAVLNIKVHDPVLRDCRDVPKTIHWELLHQGLQFLCQRRRVCQSEGQIGTWHGVIHSRQ